MIESLHGHKVKILGLKSLEEIVHVDHLKYVNKGFDDECAHQVSLSSDLTDPSSDSSLTAHTPSYRLKLRSHFQGLIIQFQYHVYICVYFSLLISVVHVYYLIMSVCYY